MVPGYAFKSMIEACSHDLSNTSKDASEISCEYPVRRPYLSEGPEMDELVSAEKAIHRSRIWSFSYVFYCSPDQYAELNV
jgi:hypothetical protein